VIDARIFLAAELRIQNFGSEENAMKTDEFVPMFNRLGKDIEVLEDLDHLSIVL
jgi:hypothetical protein